MKRLWLISKVRRLSGYSFAILLIGVSLGLLFRSSTIMRYSMFAGIVMWGVGVSIEFLIGGRKDVKEGHSFELVFGALIYAVVAYVIYTFLMLILTGH